MSIKTLVRRTVLSVAVVAAVATTGVLVSVTPASAAFTSSVGGDITRTEVIERAQYWVDHQPGPYDTTGTSWFAPDPTGSRNYRRDCSGLVDMAWHLNSDQTTFYLYQVSTEINRNDLRPGDVLNDAAQHVILFAGWEADHVHFAYYSFGAAPVKKVTHADINQSTIDGHPNGEYVARRYIHIVEDQPVSTGLVGGPGYADVNGDGKSDLVAQNGASTWVMLSTGSSFGSPALWSSTMFQGAVANQIGDVNGDGRADLVAENGSSTWVMLSSGSSFGAPTQWSGTTFQGSVGNLIGDINGDGRDDLVAENGASTWVMLSTGSSFGSPALWSSTMFQGAVANQIGDVNGDGRADLVAENGSSTWVMLSSGSSFGAPTQWSGTTFQGSVGNLIDDINGDGRDDLVAENGASTWVMLSTGSSFGSPALWSSTMFQGAVANQIGDVNGDGRADLVAENGSSTWVMTSSGSSFNFPAQWSGVTFSGSVANHG